MPFSAALRDRCRDQLQGETRVTEKKMFGGIAFLYQGHMVVAIWHDMLIARVGSELSESLIKDDYVREFDLTGRAMRGWLMVDPEGLETDAQLKLWIDRCLDFVRSLPPK